ncbi:hypothetical protein [Embleya sp. NPDC050493]|uniref:hypothetical protein n=1 Tax=Embleya sp. NPDC050493 TaxID=3363989 RepID=UPI0037B820CA
MTVVDADRPCGRALVEALAALRRDAGNPSWGMLGAAARRHRPSLKLSKSSLSTWFAGETVPKDGDAFAFLVACLEASAASRTPGWKGPSFARLRRAAEQERRRETGTRARGVREASAVSAYVPTSSGEERVASGGGREHTGGAPPTSTRPRRPAPPGRPIADLVDEDALVFGVHPAIEEPEHVRGALSVLPAYVTRALDGALHERALEAVEGRSVLVTLVGESSTGKTRACWEAVRSLPRDWRLWHPLDRETTAESLDRVGPGTVVWLDEAQNYLRSERIALLLRDLIREPGRHPVLLLATMWPDHWARLTVPPPGSREGHDDRHLHARKLLSGTALRVDSRFTGAEVEGAWAKAADDPRLVAALNREDPTRIAQYLAGAPDLLARHRNAPVATRAVLDAAVDARRLGHGTALAHDFLARAATDYIDDDEWDALPEDWYERALEECALSCHGATAPLARIRPRGPGNETGRGVYRLADVLHEHGMVARRGVCPPTSFWDSAVEHTRGGDRSALAAAARERCRLRHAALLYRPAADAGDTEALAALSRIHADIGDAEQAESFAFAAATRGNPTALWCLAPRGRRGGRLRAAAAEFGHPQALEEQVRIRIEAGEVAQAEEFALRAGSHDNGGLIDDVVDAWIDHDDWKRAEALVGKALELGIDWSYGTLARFRLDDDEAGALDYARQGLQHNITDAYRDLARARLDRGDRAGADEYLLVAADNGDFLALDDLSQARVAAGDHAAAERFAHQAADHGYTRVLATLVRDRIAAGDLASARCLAIETDRRHGTHTLRDVIAAHEQAGDWPMAETLAHKATELGDIGVLPHHAHLRAVAGDRKASLRVLRTAADLGVPEALVDLALDFLARDDMMTARELASRAAELGEHDVFVQLAKARLRLGDCAEVEDLLREGVDRHEPQASGELCLLLERTARSAEAEGLALRAAHANDHVPLGLLVTAREHTRRADAERLAHRAADLGNPRPLKEMLSRRAAAGDTAAEWRLARALIDYGFLTNWKPTGCVGRYGIEPDGTASAPWRMPTFQDPHPDSEGGSP